MAGGEQWDTEDRYGYTTGCCAGHENLSRRTHGHSIEGVRVTTAESF